MQQEDKHLRFNEYSACIPGVTLKILKFIAIGYAINKTMDNILRKNNARNRFK